MDTVSEPLTGKFDTRKLLVTDGRLLVDSTLSASVPVAVLRYEFKSLTVRLRNALDATYEGDLDLQAHKEPAGRSVPARTLEA